MGPYTSLLLAILGGCLVLVNSQNAAQGSQGASYRLPTQLYYPAWPDSYEQFLKTLMYPYNERDRAPFDASKLEHEMALTNRLPFFGFAYKYIKIHLNGYVHFGGGPREYRLPIEFPLKPDDTVSEKDPAIIAPWLTYQSLLGNLLESGVYAKLVKIKKREELDNCQLANIEQKHDCFLQKRLHDDFNGGMIGSQGFAPTFALIVTWRNMTVPQMERFGNQQKTNTYQMVLASDEIKSYVMFNYEQISWISSEDRKEGTNGLNPFIGFNAGNTTRAYEFFPYSQQPRVSQLTEGGDEAMKGRYMFQVDEEIYTGTCINWALDPHLIKQRPRLSFFPKFATMLGGTMINVTGPCFPKNAKIECQFQDMSGGRFPAIYRNRNHASCYMPPVFFHGYVDLTVTVNGGDALFYGRFYIQPPELAHEDVLIINNADKEEKPTNLILQWRKEKLSSLRDDNREVTIHLWGFNDNKEYPSLTYIDQLGVSTVSDTSIDLQLSQFNNRRNYDKLDLQFGFISINITDLNTGYDNGEKSPVVWSRPMPLAWYFWPQWEYQYGRYWKDQFCQDWFQHEQEADKFAISLWRCPCTMKQSELDRGRYAPDTLCNTYSRKCDPFYKRALQCVKSGRPSVGGSGQTCCYDMDGELILTADTMYGGKPHRFFSYGILPYNQRSKVATLATWQSDMMPFFSCCHWQSEKDDSTSCQKYKYFRTSQDCSAYQPPGFAAVYGDPHFLTFDGANYTFSGHGEFSLVYSNNEKAKINIQGRFESRRREHASDLIVNGTFLSGIAVRDNVSSTVEFHLRPLAARWQYQLYLIVDNEYIYFWDESMRTQNFKGVSIYQPTGYYNMSKIVAMFDSGAGVEVSVMHEQLVLHTFLPIDFVNITTGLLGSWDNLADNDISNDQSSQTGGFATTSDRQIYDQFGSRFRLNESSSLFNHQQFGYNFGHYDDPHFLPFFADSRGISAPLNATFREKDLDETCASSRACRYDYVATGNKAFAATTKLVEAAAHNIADDVRKTVIRCQALDKPAYGLKSEIRNFVGKIVRFTCSPGYRLYGHETRQCKESGLWSWGEAPVCKSVSSHVLTMVGIAFGILIPIAILVLCCVFCCCIRTSSSKQKDYITKERGDELRTFNEKTHDEEIVDERH